ncbi:MAG: class I SAM-dependent RNA methyltransferase [Pyrinomonadaceae bacterium]
MSKHYTTGDIIEVRVEKIVPRGFGLGFAENLTVLTPLTVPGDLVRVRIVEVKKRMAFAAVVEVKEPGPKRVEPPCEYFGKCGGCDFQQMSYQAQLAAKVGILRDCLHRIGKIEYEGEIPVIGSPNEFGYRSRARWHIDRRKRKLGYFRRDSHDIIDITHCPILTPGLQSSLEYTRESMDWDGLWADEAQVEAATGEEGRVSLYSADMVEPTAELTFATKDDTYIFSAQAFFQANKFLIGDLIEVAIGGTSGKTAFDLYSGVGLFALPLARHFEKVVAVEEHPVSVGFAKNNIKHSLLTNIEMVQSAVGRYLNGNQGREIDFVLIDPPRSGTEKQTMPLIAKLKPKEISYVSCEPSILARDLRMLLDAGYRIEKMTAIDLFPQTHHIETVVRLKCQ